MNGDIEAMLTRELRQVADHLEVPALPALPTGPPPRATAWPPLLVAAALVLVALATVATLLRTDDGQSIQPAPRPSQVATDGASGEPAPLGTGVPEIPYVLGSRLYVDGAAVPGEWFSVEGTSTGWWAVRSDGTYWWGNDDRPRPIEAESDQPPATNPSGTLVAQVLRDGGGMLFAFQTDPSGEAVGGPPVPATDDDGAFTWVAAVTDDGLVVTKGAGTAYVWRPLGDNGVVPLDRSAPGQVVLDGTPAGVVVVDGATDATQGRVYLAEVADDGTLTEVADLPHHDLLEASTQWLAWVEPGLLGGDAGTVAELSTSRVDGSQAGVLTAPEGFAFVAETVAFESDGVLVARVEDGGLQRLVRCSPERGECVLIGED